MDVPPLELVYQLIVPADELAPSETVPSPHLFPALDAVIVGIEFTEATTAVRTLEGQPLAEAPTK